jgi:hypothetical protein
MLAAIVRFLSSCDEPVLDRQRNGLQVTLWRIGWGGKHHRVFGERSATRGLLGDSNAVVVDWGVTPSAKGV